MRHVFILKFLLCFCLTLQLSTGMFQKRKGAPTRDLSIPAGQRLRSNIADLMLGNDISSLRAQSIYKDAADAGIDEMTRLANTGTGSNVPRNMLRKLMKGSKWLPIYYAPIRVWSVKLQKLVLVKLPFLLPHELIYMLQTRALTPDSLHKKDGLSEATQQHCLRSAIELGVPSVIAVSLWGDGVPCNFDRTQSIESFCMGLPGVSSTLRIPIVAINKKFVSKQVTFDDMLSVITWSFQQLASGHMPTHDHMGRPFRSRRLSLGGKALPRAVLAEMRADWAFLKSCFKFPQHNELLGVCWLCRATPLNAKDGTATATWRTDRLDTWALLQRMREQGIVLPPIWGCPCIRNSTFLIDWLHCVDQGVSQEFLGGLLLLLLPKFPGATKAAQCSAMFVDLQLYYRTHNSENRLDNLTLSMLQQPKKTPKLRGRAGEIRGVIPWALEASNRLLSDQVPLESTAKCAMGYLNQCYTNLSGAAYNADNMCEASRRFVLLYTALEAATEGKIFSLKSKVHLFMELTQLSRSNPSKTWYYRDEEFGGSVAQLSKKKGGSSNPHAVGSALLNKFLALHKSIPIL